MKFSLLTGVDCETVFLRRISKRARSGRPGASLNTERGLFSPSDLVGIHSFNDCAFLAEKETVLRSK